MARQRRSLEEHVAELSMRSRMGATQYLSTPPLPTVTGGNVAWGTIQSEHISDKAINFGNLSGDLQETITRMTGDSASLLTRATSLESRVDSLETRIDALTELLASGPGIVDYWTNAGPLAITQGTVIHTVSLPVAAHAVTRVTVNLRGTASIPGQHTLIQAVADGVIYGEHTAYSPNTSHPSTTTAVFMLPGAKFPRQVAFEIVGITPAGTTFTIPTRAAGGPPQTEVTYEDIGPLP